MSLVLLRQRLRAVEDGTRCLRASRIGLWSNIAVINAHDGESAANGSRFILDCFEDVVVTPPKYGLASLFPNQLQSCFLEAPLEMTAANDSPSSGDGPED
jgi:hypothetical protein